ncbi:MAG TPA: energy transducer TonB [Bryobacteraceae bacterium]|nr:energy transducer TonB [Bryobacteraceae bacterium]
MAQQGAWRSSCIFCLIALCVFPLARAQDKQSTGESDEKVYDLGPDVSPPRVTKQVSPNYKTARGVRLEGSVTVGLIVSSQGVPRDVRIVKGIDKDVDQSAVEAVRQWRFAPARKDDKPVAVRVSLELDFHSM